MTNARDLAEGILAQAEKLGWRVEVGDDILTIHKHFTPGDNDGFVECDGQYFSILGLLPRTRPGSTWGTDGGGVGAVEALRRGHFTMNVSGGSKMVLKQLKKLLEVKS